MILLVRHHGLVGCVFQGEEPIPALEHLTARQDEQLLDAFVLQAILNAAAIREGLMVSDLLEWLLTYRTIGHHIIAAKSSWQAWLEEALQEKGATVIPDFRLTDSSATAQLTGFTPAPESSIKGNPEDTLWLGRQAAALERLLKLMGVTWVDFQDLQLCLMKMPAAFIYYKKKLKSVGLSTFEAQLQKAGRTFELVSALSPEARHGLLYGLDHLGGSLRISDFHYLPEFLEIDACLKLLIISMAMCQKHFGSSAKNQLIAFGPLSHKIAEVHAALQKDLHNLPFPTGIGDFTPTPSGDHHYRGIHFEANAQTQAIRVDYRYTVHLDLMVQSLAAIWDRESLHQHFDELIGELREKLPFGGRDLEASLRKAFAEQSKKINYRALEEFQERLSRVHSFWEFHELKQELERRQAELQFSEEQRFLLKEVFEFHRFRIRDRYLETIDQKIQSIHSEEALVDYWNSLKYELFSFRAHLGKEYELLIAQFINQKLEEMRLKAAE